MKKKIFMLLAFVMAAMTASATDVPTYSLTKADGAEAHGTITFKVGENTVTSAAEGDVVTVILTPATGWVVNQPSGQWFAAIAAAPQRRTGIDLLKGVTLTPVQGQENQWQFTMARANVEINTTYKKLMTHTDITVADITAPTYTGQALTPTVTVKDGETALVLNTDYTVAYSNNTNAAQATATSNAPTVTITGIGEKYAGSASKTFTINKAALTVTAENKTVTFGDDAPTYSVTYDGFVNNETNAVLGGTLAFDCGYVKNQSGVDEYTITPSGLTSDNYAITFTAGKLTVGKKALAADLIATIPALTYTGSALEPAPVVTFNEMTLVAGADKDYTVAYTNNTNAGTATVTITATENCNYSGSASKTFTINKKALENSMIGAIDVVMTYTGNAFTPEPTVTYNGMTLVKTTDFAYSYENNVNAALATATEKAPTVTITAAENCNYSGSASKTFTINAAPGSVWFYPSKYEKTFGDEDFTVEPTMVTGDGSLFYWSKNEDVATVDSKTGLVHIVGTGIAYINATIGATGNYTTASDYYVLTVNPKEVEYDSGDVTQDEDGYTVTMTEDENKPNADPLPDDADLSNLTYDRDLTAPGNEQGGDGSGDVTIDEQPANMYTVCLPFAPKKDAAVKYYTLSSVVGETLVFDEVADAQSHTPYLVAVFGDVNVREDCSDLDVSSMTINSTTVDGYTFNGTFTGKKNADALGLYILQRNMQWGKVTSGNVYIPPFRAFVEAPASSAPQLNGTIGDGSATGIKNIRTVDLNGTERWYDLSGRRMVTPAKGIYINNGRKVVVK